MITNQQIIEALKDNMIVIVNLNEYHTEEHPGYPKYQKAMMPQQFNPSDFSGFTDMQIYPNGIDSTCGIPAMILTESE